MASTAALPAIGTDTIPPELLAEARRLWAGRVRSEYRSIQIVAQLLTEVLAGGAAHDTQQVLLEMVQDEMRHAELCAQVCVALGHAPPPPQEVAAPLPAMDAVPLSERVLAHGISLFLVNECFSVAYIEDLARRCRHPVLGPVLVEIAGDEDEHEAFGERFVRQRLAQESDERRAGWRVFAGKLVRTHLDKAEQALDALPAEQLDLARHAEPELADLGLTSPARMALLTLQTWEQTLQPRLARLGLLDEALREGFAPT